MSIPLDFVGLNNLLVKKPGFDKNTLNNLFAQKPIVINSAIPLTFTRKEIMPAKDDQDRLAKYYARHWKGGESGAAFVKEYSINICFEIPDMDSIPAFAVTSHTVANPYRHSEPIYQIISTNNTHIGIGLDADDGDYAYAGNSIAFIKNSNDSNNFNLFAIRGLYRRPLGANLSTGINNLTIVFYDSDDRNLHKSSKGDQNTSNYTTPFNKYCIYLNGQNISDSNSDKDGNIVSYIHGLFNLKYFIEPQGKTLSGTFLNWQDEFIHFGTGFTAAQRGGYFDGGALSYFDPSINMHLHSIAAWDRPLTKKEIVAVSQIDNNYFLKLNNYKYLKNYDPTNGLANLIPTPSFLKTSEEYENNLSDFSEPSIVSSGYSNNFIGTLNKELGFSLWNTSSADNVKRSQFFSAYYNNVNGPYGFSAFKQLRSSQNWLMRAYSKNNTFSFISENGQERVVIKDGKTLSNHKDKYGAITNVTETPATDQHNPIEMIATVSDGFDDEKLMIKASYSNENQFFKNKVVNVETSRELEDSKAYDDLIAIMDNETTPLKSFDKLTYKQSIFPKNLYTHSKNHRVRPSYSSDIWRDVRASRTETGTNNGFGYYTPSQSFWPLDAEENFTTLPASNYYGGALGYNSFGAAGILQNSYSLFATSSTLSGVEVDNVVSASVLYSRPHTITSSTSVKNPFFTSLSGGMIGDCSKLTGHAKWEAPSMAGFYNADGNFQVSPKQPFPDSYEEWSESFRGLGKGYSIVPEFRISDHVNHYLTNGFTAQKLDALDVKGGNSDYAKSSDSDFYKVYSTTDFLKNFEVVKGDIGKKAKPISITLRCKAIKKFLPYEGFYPCQRTVDIAKQFYDSYGFFISGSSWDTHANGSSIMTSTTDVSSTSKYISQNLMTPLFSPGILFNSIKSGIACDFPVMTYNYNTSSTATISNSKLQFVYIPSHLPSTHTYGILKFTTNSLTFQITASSTNATTDLGGGVTRIEFDNTGASASDKTLSLHNQLNTISGYTSGRVHDEPLPNSATITLTSDNLGLQYNFSDVTENPTISPNVIFGYTLGSYSNPHTSSNNENYHIASDFDKRIPFEALMEPEKYLANYELFSMEPDPQSPKIKSVWAGQGDELYKLMINNFVSEVGDFFLQNEKHTTITSLPEGDPNFGNAQINKIYGMRLKMFRTITGSKGTGTSHLGEFAYPQDTGSMGEGFTMYSRPSAFGPPAKGHSGLYKEDVTSGLGFIPKTWSKFKFSGSINYSYDPDGMGLDTPSVTLQYPENGENYTHTPPYYHGEAWCDIFFKPPTGAKKYSLSEIINNSSAEFFRYFNSGSAAFSDKVHPGSRGQFLNDQSMQIASSMNIFSRGILHEDSENLTINTQLEAKYRWIIQSKWESPTLNFNHLSHEDLTMPPAHATSSVPIGMWHQYGRLPQRTDEGIFIQVTNVPENWIKNVMGGNTYTTGSLVDLCGFSADPIRVGEIKNTKLIEEAVVAVPFVNRNGFREFFKLKKEDVHRAINGIEEAVGPTVFKLTQQLDKYVFPPQFDYKRNKDITPVAMYVFEFSHEFTKQDLADIWQNLMPELGEVHETAEATVSHSLFAEELLGRGADPKKTANGIERNIPSDLTDLPSDIQWMVFKVKKRASSSYFEKMYQRNESRNEREGTNFTVDSTGKKTSVSFNWPYDFFSMVELIKLDAEVEFSNVDKEKSIQENRLVTKPYIFRED